MKPACRACGWTLDRSFCDLGMTPLSNAYLREEDLGRGETFYPLHALLCSRCLLVQLAEFRSPQDIFSEYAYFSSYSDTWLRHAEAYAAMAVRRFALGAQSRVVELASNDGYLLQYFQRLSIPVLGVEPAANVARAAMEKGVPTRVEFFGDQCARRIAAEQGQADLIVANNVLAHVPDLRDFLAGVRTLLSPSGSASFEFPHLLRLMQENQFDTIYHEHFSYFSLVALEPALAAAGLAAFDVEELATHGGSLRLYVRHSAQGAGAAAPSLAKVRTDEERAGLRSVQGYTGFEASVRRTKQQLLAFLIDAKRAGKRIGAYGAAAKGNTLLNYCGAGRDFIDFVADRSPHKQGRFLPGTHLPVVEPAKIRAARPDFLLILPWNLREEIMDQNGFIREWGGRFVLPIPSVAVL